jgi:oxygen-dependent protoporphyrinogen oxidase
LCRARLGDEVTDWLVDPLLGGINASDIDSLSLRAGAPLLAAAADLGPSLMKGLAELRPASGAALGSADGADPVFLGLPGGVARIIDALVAAVDQGDNLHLSRPVDSLAAAGAGFDGVVLATPTAGAAQLLGPVSPEAAAELAAIGYASVAQVVVELPRHGVERELDASGVLFPRVGGHLLTACTWLSSKWAHYRRPGSVLLRLSSGRFGDERSAALDDDSLTSALLDDLRSVEAITAAPIARRVQRWSHAFPQYAPGHGARVERIEAAVAADAPTVRLAGAGYHGIGVPACIDSGRRAARSLLEASG